MNLEQILISSSLWWWFSASPYNLRAYERSFIKMRGPHANLLIRETELLQYNPILIAKLCAYRRRKTRNRDLYSPRPATYYIGFKRVYHDPLLTEVVPCDTKKALVEAPGNNCVFVLRRNRGPRTLFYIHRKYCFKDPWHKATFARTNS